MTTEPLTPEERCYCAAHAHNGHPVDIDTDAARSTPAALDVERLARWAMVGDLNNRHMDVVPDGEFVRLADLRAALGSEGKEEG